MDLIEGKKRDVQGIGKQYNWYWLMVVDRLSGLADVETLASKKAEAKYVAGALERILNRMQAKLGVRVTNIDSDDGAEFKGETQKLLDRRNIKRKIVPRASKCEQVNQTFQRIFYRLFRLGRWDRQRFKQLTQQALVLFNNTKTRIHGFTPNEAAGKPANELSPAYNKTRQKASIPKGPGMKKLLVGMKVRYLLKPRDKVKFYKAYRAQHWSQTKHVIKAAARSTPPRFYISGKGWKARDMLLHAP